MFSSSLLVLLFLVSALGVGNYLSPEFIPNIYFPVEFHKNTIGFDIMKVTGGKPQNIRMAYCLTCHQGDYNTNNCTRCHKGKPPNHNDLWQKTHKIEAKDHRDRCMACHKESFCANCHQVFRTSNAMPDSHIENWASNHSSYARVNADKCGVCHPVEYCSQCHANNNRHLTQSTGTLTKPLSHSDSNFMSSGNANRHHSAMFRRNPRTCLMCHPNAYADTRCASYCHAGENPHPAGFDAPITDMCRRCHVAGGPANARPF